MPRSIYSCLSEGNRAPPPTAALVSRLKSSFKSSALSNNVFRKSGVPAYAVTPISAAALACSSLCPTPAGKTVAPTVRAPFSNIIPAGVI